MNRSLPAAPTALSPQLRLLLAFILGFLAGIIFFFNPNTSAFPAELFLIPFVLLLAAALLSVFLDPAVRQGTQSPVPPLMGLLIVALIIGFVAVLLALIPSLQMVNTYIALALVPLAIGFAVAFTFAITGRTGFNILLGLLGWLGAAIPIVINAVLYYIAYEQITPGGDGGIALPLTLAYVILAFALAALGGFLGGLLRTLLFSSTPKGA